MVKNGPKTPVQVLCYLCDCVCICAGDDRWGEDPCSVDVIIRI